MNYVKESPTTGTVRSDSWAAQLTEMQQWDLYAKSREPNATWTEVVRWAVEKYKLKKTPSHSSYFRWRQAMAEEEHRYKVEEAALNALHTAEIGKTAPDDETLHRTIMAFATMALMREDFKGASELIKMACNARRIGFVEASTRLRVSSLDIRQKELEIKQMRFDLYRRKMEKELDPPRVLHKLTPAEQEQKIKAILGVS